MKKKHKSKEILNHTSSLFFATFSEYQKKRRTPRNGMVDQVLSVFLPKVDTLLLLDQPHPVSDSVNPIVEVYNKKKLVRRYSFPWILYFSIYFLCKRPSKKRTRTSYKLRDFFSVLWIGLLSRKKYDLFIGMESINALAGIVLKKFGKVNTVVYYVSDYAPARFGKNLFNSIYLWLDRFCVMHADCTWDVSPAMKTGRMEAGMSEVKMKKVIHVPNGLFPNQIVSLPVEKRSRDSLVYLGSLDTEFGADLAIESLKEIKKKKPNATLRIIGGGSDITRLKALTKRLHLENSVSLYGFVADNEEMAKIVRSSYVGIAPYRALKDLSRWYGWYGDAGKIRQYLASGLPVVTTHVPPLGRYIVKQGAGIMVKDSVKDFSEATVKLLLDKQLYLKLTKKAEKLSQENTWENSYLHALSEMKKLGTLT